MTEAQPHVSRELVRVLHAMGHHDLADQLPDQPFHGRCTCTPNCTFALTAPPGSSGTSMIWLELDGETIGQASLNPDGTRITDFEIGEPDVLGPHPTWLDEPPRAHR
jgi:hypothetical protein